MIYKNWILPRNSPQKSKHKCQQKPATLFTTSSKPPQIVTSNICAAATYTILFNTKSYCLTRKKNKFHLTNSATEMHQIILVL